MVIVWPKNVSNDNLSRHKSSIKNKKLHFYENFDAKNIQQMGKTKKPLAKLVRLCQKSSLVTQFYAEKSLLPEKSKDASLQANFLEWYCQDVTTKMKSDCALLIVQSGV